MLPPSYAKNYKRGLDRFLSQLLGVEPAAVEKIVFESATDAEIDAINLRDQADQLRLDDIFTDL